MGHFQRPFSSQFSKALAIYSRLYRFAQGSGRPFLIISYDEAIDDRERVVSSLINLCGLVVTDKDIQAALAFMDREKGYQWLLDDATAVVGIVEQVDLHQVGGWCFSPRSDAPVTLALLQNGNEIARTTADKPRIDVAENPSFARLYCGFAFDFPAQNLRVESGKLQVVEVGSGCVLRRLHRDHQ